ncbi:MAG TPA: hypothetical protein PLZ77_06405 [Lachnospiraceae bacterium]|nr:hypothetical protein [Lachnospiraceae bacterium]HPF29722.1 hypothetical protein [Lachnospiraceae bacterium]
MKLNENDYKYVLQEFSKVMIGARYTYEELLMNERVPFKFQTIIDRYILPYADSKEEIGKHLLRMTKEDPNYRIYENLKIQIGYYKPKAGGGFEQKKVSLEQLTKEAEHWNPDSLIYEVMISNLALMAFKI